MNKPERRLAAIVAIDVAGYSRLMHADEVGTLEQLKQLRSITDPMSREHGGRIVGTAGDGFLLEFPSVVEAVSCALRVQQSVAEFNANTPEDQKMLFRIGINLGDVMVDGDDLLGDGVNVAARLEGLAEPGGICISRAARDQVRDKLDINLDDLGEIEVKNIARPVRAFSITSGLNLTGERKSIIARKFGHRISPPLVIAVAALIVLVSVGSIYLFNQAGGNEPATKDVFALPTGPKVIVLPFKNLNNDPEQDYFANGLQEDITTRLASHTYLFVIAGDTARKYQSDSAGLQKVSKELGLDYVLTGSVRKSQGTIRVSTQLLDAVNGSSVWAKSYDRELNVKNILQIQDDISSMVESEIAGDVAGGTLYREVAKETEAKHPDDLEAFECVFLANHYWVTQSPKVHLNARTCLEKVVEQYPNHYDAWNQLGWMYYVEFTSFANPLPNPLERALKAAERSIEINSKNSHPFRLKAWINFFRRNRSQAIHYIEKALVLDPNLALNPNQAGAMLIRLGEWERGEKLLEKAIALNPNPQWWYYQNYMFVFYKRGQFQRALDELLKSRITWFHWQPGLEAIVLAELDRLEEANLAVERALKVKPDFAETAKSEIEFWWWDQPEMIDQFTKALAKAGLQMPDA